jgi:hypothetical protein
MLLLHERVLGQASSVASLLLLLLLWLSAHCSGGGLLCRMICLQLREVAVQEIVLRRIASSVVQQRESTVHLWAVNALCRSHQRAASTGRLRPHRAQHTHQVHKVIHRRHREGHALHASAPALVVEVHVEKVARGKPCCPVQTESLSLRSALSNASCA